MAVEDKKSKVKPEIPEQVRAAMVEAGAVDPRNGNPSLSALSRETGIHTTTIGKLFLYGKRLEPENEQALAEALGIETAKLVEWCTGQRNAAPYAGPRGSEILTPYQREAVDLVINAFIKDNRGKQRKAPEKTTDPVPEHGTVGDHPGTEEKTPDGPSQADLRLAARRGGRKFEPEPKKRR